MMNWTSFDTWIVVTGALCAVACALPGCFLVLRGMSMMGDAISHAVLPGLAVAFLITSSRASIEMFVSAAIAGVLTALFTQWVSRFGNVDRGAAMGIVFTTLFAIGLLLIVQGANHVDLDPGCVLYGALEYTPLLTLSIGAFDIPQNTLILATISLLNLALILLFFKELRLSSFDPALSSSLGINSSLMHYLLMTMVAITTVAAFESVGSIIVIAMFIVPPATALLLTKRLIILLPLAAFLGVLSAILGHYSSQALPPLFGYNSTNSQGMIAVASGFLFVLAWGANLFHTRFGTRAESRASNITTGESPPAS